MSKSSEVYSQQKCLSLFASGSDVINCNKLQRVDIDLNDAFDGYEENRNDYENSTLPKINQVLKNKDNNVLNKYKIMKKNRNVTLN